VTERYLRAATLLRLDAAMSRLAPIARDADLRLDPDLLAHGR
jgi:hypothetical protein